MATLHVQIIVCQSTPQKFPTFDSTSALSAPVSVAQGLEEKQLSSGPHSSPPGQGVLFSQFCAWSSYVFPQKFVFTVGTLEGDKDAAGTLEGDKDAAISDGDKVGDKLLGNIVDGWVDFVSSSLLAAGGREGDSD